LEGSGCKDWQLVPVEQLRSYPGIEISHSVGWPPFEVFPFHECDNSAEDSRGDYAPERMALAWERASIS